MADAIDKIISQVKKLQEKLEAMEGDNAQIAALKDKITDLESKLDRNPDFGEW